MTVQELIEKLKTYPPDAVVVYEFQSDYTEMDAAELELWQAKYVQTGPTRHRQTAFRRDGQHVMAVTSDCSGTGWKLPDYADWLEAVVIFPGN